jgi:hypothetical protein
MTGNNKDHGRSRRPSAVDRGWSDRSGTRSSDDWEVGWCRVWFAPCTSKWGAQLSWLSLETRSTVCQWFDIKTTGMVLSVVWPQNHLDNFLQFGLKTSGDGFLRFGLKTSGDGFSWFDLKTGGASKPRWWRVSRFGPQNRQLRFCDLDLKITVAVSWFGPQNQGGFSLSIAPQNRREDETVWDTHWDLASCFAWK